jgi:hypothetical protein
MAISKMIYDDRSVPMSWHEVESFQIVFGQEDGQAKGTAAVASYSSSLPRQKELKAKAEGNGSADFSISRISVPVVISGEMTLANVERTLLQTEYFQGGERQVYSPEAGRGIKAE